MAAPGFPVVGTNLVGGGGRRLPRRLRFENFVCQRERIWTLRGGGGDAHPGSANDCLHFTSPARLGLAQPVPPKGWV